MLSCSHCLGYMTSTDSISHRLGGLYCLYCIHETQPFNPPFRIYLSPAEKVIDTHDINHIAENQTLIGDVVGKTIADWNIHKETFYQKTGLNKRQLLKNQSQVSKENIDAVELNEKSEEQDDGYVENDDHFIDELEQLLSL
ncbi:small nuclear RNA activating complex, subunit SNAP43 protein [Tanacetum coccineum]